MKTFTALAGVLALGACGSMGNSEGVGGTEVAALDKAAAAVSDSAASYRTSTATMATSADCTAALKQYSAQVQPNLDHIAQMSGRMDSAMSSMGQTIGADMECGAGVMQHELAQHLSVACTAPDIAANRAEAARHSGAMQEFADHLRMRADEMGTMMGSGMGHAMMDGGWVTPDGGAIPFDHTMPGCTYGDGAFHADRGSPNDGGSAQ